MCRILILNVEIVSLGWLSRKKYRESNRTKKKTDQSK